MKKVIVYLGISIIAISSYGMSMEDKLYEAYNTGQQYGLKYKDDKKNLESNRQKGFDYCRKKYFPNKNIAYYCAMGVGFGIFDVYMSSYEFKKTMKK